MINPRKQIIAFTLIELLVSIALTLLLVFMIGRLFTDTQAAVSQGVAMGRVIENSRGVCDQFARDFKGMIGPDDGGFLVISQQRDANGFRRDQIMFIKRATGVTPLTPAYADNFSNSFQAEFSRVWYGHADRTNANGAGLYVEPNAERWILGRQELLLHGAFTSPPPIPNHATGALAASIVSGYSGEPAPAGTGFVYMGMTDLADVTLTQLTGVGAPLTAASDPAYTNYRAAVYPYTFMADRMRTNPAPLNAWCYQVAQAHPYFSEGVSDFIIEMAGDFDPVNGIAGQVDRVSSGPEQGSIIWYSHFYDSSDPTQAQPAVTFGPYDNNPTAPYNNHAAAAFTFQQTNAAVFPNAKDAWPHMIRIRWRHHDPNGTLVTTTSTPNTPLQGRWFEQIFYVPR